MSNMHNSLCSCAECQIVKTQSASPPPAPAGKELVPKVTIDGQQLFQIDALVSAYSVDGVHYFQDAKLAIASTSRSPREIKLIEAKMMVQRLEGEDRVRLMRDLVHELASEARGEYVVPHLRALSHVAAAMAELVGSGHETTIAGD